MSNVAPESDYRFRKKSDPQVTVTGTVKQSKNSEVIVFSFSLSLFEIVCVVTIPQDGTNVAPVYIKFRVRQ